MMYKYGQYGRNAGLVKVERWYRINDSIVYVEKRTSNYRVMWKIGSLVITMPLPGKLEESDIETYHEKFEEALKHLR